jgi:hypothetical protein
LRVHTVFAHSPAAGLTIDIAPALGIRLWGKPAPAIAAIPFRNTVHCPLAARVYDALLPTLLTDRLTPHTIPVIGAYAPELVYRQPLVTIVTDAL